jgi:tRNA(Ile2) C34 agmatinyltransferase TiaS
MSNTTTAPTGVVSSTELGGIFTVAHLKVATMTELASLRAAKGFCPKCQQQMLSHVSRGGGLTFRQCAECKTVAVLAD